LLFFLGARRVQACVGSVCQPEKAWAATAKALTKAA